MNDLIERLRSLSEGKTNLAWGDWMSEAADEIERLRARIAELEAQRGDELRSFIENSPAVPSVPNTFKETLREKSDGK